MGSSFSNLDKSWGCTSFGASSSKSHRKESTGLCRCPKNYPPGYTLPSPSRTKTSSLPINEPSNCVITSLTSVNTYNCTCKSSVAHHHLNSDTHPSNTDSGFHSRVFNSQAFIPRDPSISVRVSLPNSISNREQLCTDQSHCLNGVGKCTNDNGARKKNAFTNLSTSTDYAIEQFRNLISSWSCNELCCLYLEYEALYEFQLLWKDAIKTRLRAPTLKDDLSSLAQHGWCFNIYLIHNDYAREAHSYILASRLSAFDLLNSVCRTKAYTCSSESTESPYSKIDTFSTPVTSTFSNKLSFSNNPSMNSLDISDSFINHISDMMKPEQCPDLLSTSRLKLKENLCKVSEMNANHQRRLPNVNSTGPSSLKINIQDMTDSSEVFLINFLSQLYTGNDPKHTISKPDLLHQPEVHNRSTFSINGGNLSKLYDFLRFSSQNKCLMSSDCELIFTCPSILSLKSISLPCHAGILACRSEFLRRLLLKRCKSNPTHHSTHKIVLDGTILPAHFASVLLHFFYCDYLNLNEISNLLLIIDKQRALSKQHSEWHIKHYSGKNSYGNYSCCRPVEIDQPTTKTYSSSWKHAYSSYTESDSGSFFTLIHFLMNSSEFRVKHFCLRCPFCLTHIIQLHPIGAILEFPKLSEACEDLLAEALSIPLITHESHENSNSAGISTSMSVQEGSVKMNLISLAVGLLKWIDGKSLISSPLPEKFSNTHYSYRNTVDSSVVSQLLKSNDDFLPSMDNQDASKPGDINSQLSPYNGTSLGFVYRHAVQCLQQNFTSLVRSPSILRRLSPRQLHELLDSSLVQAPESEILAGLLCWAELQLKSDQNSFCGVKSGNGSPRDNHAKNEQNKTQDNVYLEYCSVLSSLVDNPFMLNCNHSSEGSVSLEDNDCQNFNHWLLLCMGWNEIEENIKKSTLYTHSSRSQSCRLCQMDSKSSMIDEYTRNHNLEKVIGQIGLKDLLAIVKLLNEHNLLSLLQTAHLLSPMPNELASVLLSYCNTADYISQDSPTVYSQNTLYTTYTNSKQYCDNTDSPWLPLIHVKKSSQSVCSEKQFSFEKVLSNPWNPSPAYFAAKFHWARLLCGNISKDDEANLTSDCICCWNKHRLTDNTISFRKSWSSSSNLWTQFGRMKSPEVFRPPRLYFAFLNEVRMMFIQKHAVHHQKLHLMKTTSSKSNDLQSFQSECTCWEFLLSHRFDQSHNLTNISSGVSKHPESPSLYDKHGNSLKFTHSHCHQHQKMATDTTTATTTTITNITSHSNKSNNNNNSNDMRDLSSECDLSFPDLAKKRFGSKSNDKVDYFFFNKKFTICCDYKCRDFAYCLLPSNQWTKIIDYYMRLVREYMNDPISHHPCTDNDYIHHVIRLRSLWKYGLPDSLESLLLCRINEHMFMLQQPKQQYSTLEYNPIKVKSSSEYKSCISTTSLCTYSLPFMNIMSCERHTQNMNSSPDMRGEEVSKINSTVITTTPIASRSLYTLSSSVTSKMNTNQLNENSQQLVSINKSSQLCSICDNKITSSPVSNNQKLSPEKKSLYSGNHKLLKKTQCSVYSCKDCRRNFVTSFKPDYCYHNSYFSSSCEPRQNLCVQCYVNANNITTTITTATSASIVTPSNVPTYLYDHRLCCIYSDSDYLCSDPLLLLSSSNYHTLVNRNKLNCCNQHRYNGHQTQQHQHLHQSDILCRPYRISTTTTSSSPCYRKVLFHCKEAQSKFVYHPSAYTPTKSSLNTLNRNNDQTTIVVTEDQYSSKLKLSTKKFRNVDFQTKIFSPLLLTLPCHSTVNHSMSSSFAWKSNPSSDSASYYSSSSSPSSSTSFSRTNSSPLSVASN